MVGWAGLHTKGGGGMINLREGGSAAGVLLPPSVDEWRPHWHLARFVVELIEGLDPRALIGSYRGSGNVVPSDQPDVPSDQPDHDMIATPSVCYVVPSSGIRDYASSRSR